MSIRNIGVMGGGFDPPHKFHIAMAERAVEFLNLEKLLFLPAFSSPPKLGKHKASFADRVNMLKIATRHLPKKFEVCDIEARAEGVSYAVDSAREISLRYAPAKLYWIIGADQLAILHRWKDIEMLSALASFAFFKRQNVEIAAMDNLPENARVIEIPFSESPISSKQTRNDLMERSNSINLDRRVLGYIAENGLYGIAKPLPYEDD